MQTIEMHVCKLSVGLEKLKFVKLKLYNSYLIITHWGGGEWW